MALNSIFTTPTAFSTCLVSYIRDWPLNNRGEVHQMGGGESHAVS